MRRTASVNRRGLVIEDAPPGANLPTSLFIRARYGYGGTPSSEQGPNESYTPILKQSDVILVHQTHANGWADGTVVRESTRGWIPTNYCEAYDPENIRSLLVAVADLWTFISTRDGRDQPLEGGLNRLQPMIAGVRSLLDETDCLRSGDIFVQNNVAIRTIRKNLLSDLSTLVNLQGQINSEIENDEEDNASQMQSLLNQAFQVLTRAVRFLDVWNDNKLRKDADLESPPCLESPEFDRGSLPPRSPPKPVSRQNLAEKSPPQEEERDVVPPIPRRSPSRRLAMAKRSMRDLDTVPEDKDVMQTADSGYGSANSADSEPEAASSSGDVSPSESAPNQDIDEADPMAQHEGTSENDTDKDISPTAEVPEVISPTVAVEESLGSPSEISERDSLPPEAEPVTVASNARRASDCLSAAHNEFLNHVGGFIGLHRQARSRSELMSIIAKSKSTSTELIDTLKSIASQASLSWPELDLMVEVMQQRHAELLGLARRLLQSMSLDDELAEIDPAKSRALVVAATSCVRCAGECVAQARTILDTEVDMMLSHDEAPADSVSPRRPRPTPIQAIVASSHQHSYSDVAVPKKAATPLRARAMSIQAVKVSQVVHEQPTVSPVRTVQHQQVRAAETPAVTLQQPEQNDPFKIDRSESRMEPIRSKASFSSQVSPKTPSAASPKQSYGFPSVPDATAPTDTEKSTDDRSAQETPRATVRASAMRPRLSPNKSQQRVFTPQQVPEPKVQPSVNVQPLDEVRRSVRFEQAQAGAAESDNEGSPKEPPTQTIGERPTSKAVSISSPATDVLTTDGASSVASAPASILNMQVNDEDPRGTDSPQMLDAEFEERSKFGSTSTIMPSRHEELESPRAQSEQGTPTMVSEIAGSTTTESPNTLRNSVHTSVISTASGTSTRATTPEERPAKRLQDPSNNGQLVSHMSVDSSVLGASVASEIDEADTSTEHGFEQEPEQEPEQEEEQDPRELVHGPTGTIVGGTLNALISKLISRYTPPTGEFVETFFLTYRRFTNAMELANTLMERFATYQDSGRGTHPAKYRILATFSLWLREYWSASGNEAALDRIRRFVNSLHSHESTIGGPELSELSVLTMKLRANPSEYLSTRRTEQLKQIHESGVRKAGGMPPTISRGQLELLKHFASGSTSCIITDFDAAEIARQLTITDSDLFCAIEPSELLALEWTKKNGKADHVRAMSGLSTELANLVADSILTVEDVTKRANIIKHWIKIARHCCSMNNYDTLMAITASLGSSTILRLGKTWALVPKGVVSQLDDLRNVVEVSRNYSTMRHLVQKATLPCLPFVGIYLTDLTFVDAGNQDTRELMLNEETGQALNVINYDKHTRTANIIKKLQKFQVPYPYQEVPELQGWIQSELVRVGGAYGDDITHHFFQKSLQIEPREDAVQEAVQSSKKGPAFTNPFMKGKKASVYNTAAEQQDKTAAATATAGADPPATSSGRGRFGLKSKKSTQDITVKRQNAFAKYWGAQEDYTEQTKIQKRA